jgi:hypothetical protein
VQTLDIGELELELEEQSPAYWEEVKERSSFGGRGVGARGDDRGGGCL